MAYRFAMNEALPKAIRRVVAEEMDDAHHQLTDPSVKPDEGIHAARRDFKKVRALLHLLRDELGEETFRKENACLRDLGQRLAGPRDATVLADTLRALVVGGAPVSLRRVAADIEAKGAAASAELVGSGDAAGEAIGSLEAARQRLVDWPLKRSKTRILKRGIRRIYGRGRQALATLDRAPSGENFHEWRKRVKQLWYVVRLLQDAWPVMLAPLAEELHTLSTLLGEHHDLVVLRDAIGSEDAFGLSSDQREALSALLRDELSARQEKVLPMGWRLYVEKPRPFTRRILAYVSLARSSGGK